VLKGNSRVKIEQRRRVQALGKKNRFFRVPYGKAKEEGDSVLILFFFVNFFCFLVHTP